MKKLLIVLLSIQSMVLMASNVVIKGELKNLKEETKTVELENISTQEIITTSDIVKNKFTISSKISEPGFYGLAFSETEYLLLILKPKDKINITLDMEKLLKPEFNGSDENKDFYTQIAALGEISEVEDSIEQVFNANYGINDTIAAQAVMHYQMMEMQKKVSMQSFITSHTNYLVSLYFTEQLSIDENFTLFKTLSDDLVKIYPANEYVLSLRKKVEKAKKTAIGVIAPEISLPSTEGKEIALSSLRGKYVLIDFWAAWCGPCRKESPNMVALYNQYHDKGFEIYSVSLDQKKESWLKAIKDDGLGKWTHVSDLKYWNSVAAQDYGVQAIPFTILIDKEGKIIAKNLRGNDLKKKISDLLD